VSVGADAGGGQPQALPGAGARHAPPDDRRRLALDVVAPVARGEPRDVDAEVDAIEQRPAQALGVLRQAMSRAAALPALVAAKAARTSVRVGTTPPVARLNCQVGVGGEPASEPQLLPTPR
jgi:hypothetical protein